MLIGFKGGPLIEAVDTAIGMNNFFSVVKKVVVPARKDLEWPIFFDRFYKRYLRENEFDKIKIIMDAINEEFSKHPASVVSDILKLDSESKDLMLSEYYIKYFEKFYYCYTTALA
ncbi:hypothetical protein VQ643_04160, partial [Pseudomonas sp. F1_0610]|uniref:hypothetical protein n=1 Tax=Pseudomonas sp. F1_0610 TaxID=3114284 RepID=UPI0039C01176